MNEFFYLILNNVLIILCNISLLLFLFLQLQSFLELLGDILAEEPKKPGNVEERVVVVDGIPKVEESRFNKLKTVLQNIFNKIGPIKSFHMPKDELNKTKG